MYPNHRIPRDYVRRYNYKRGGGADSSPGNMTVGEVQDASTPEPAPSFSTLPSELLSAVLAWTGSGLDICHAAATSRRMASVIVDDLVWEPLVAQYSISQKAKSESMRDRYHTLWQHGRDVLLGIPGLTVAMGAAQPMTSAVAGGLTVCGSSASTHGEKLSAMLFMAGVNQLVEAISGARTLTPINAADWVCSRAAADEPVRRLVLVIAICMHMPSARGRTHTRATHSRTRSAYSRAGTLPRGAHGLSPHCKRGGRRALPRLGCSGRVPSHPAGVTGTTRHAGGALTTMVDVVAAARLPRLSCTGRPPPAASNPRGSTQRV